MQLIEVSFNSSHVQKVRLTEWDLNVMDVNLRDLIQSLIVRYGSYSGDWWMNTRRTWTELSNTLSVLQFRCPEYHRRLLHWMSSRDSPHLFFRPAWGGQIVDYNMVNDSKIQVLVTRKHLIYLSLFYPSRDLSSTSNRRLKSIQTQLLVTRQHLIQPISASVLCFHDEIEPDRDDVPRLRKSEPRMLKYQYSKRLLDLNISQRAVLKSSLDLDHAVRVVAIAKAQFWSHTQIPKNNSTWSPCIPAMTK